MLYEVITKVAADIQISILPDVLPSPPRFDFGARIDPARQVGGDFYDIFRIGENKVAVLIGDVADKGVITSYSIHYTKLYELWNR